MIRQMLRIEDKTTKHYKSLVEDAITPLFSVLPTEDLKNIEKIVLFDECPKVEFKWAGGFYYSAYNGKGAIIELYPPKILAAKPFFVPKTRFSTKYSIVKMFLHELGHHKMGNLDLQNREFKAQEYMVMYIKKIYGSWIYFFDFLARIDDLITRRIEAKRIKQE